MFVSYSLCLYQKSIWTRFYLPCLHIVKRSSRVVGDTRLRVLSALPAQKQRARQTKCASLYPVEGSPYLMFSCSRGMNSGTQGSMDCSRRMRLDTFIKHWHPEMHRHWMREKENGKAGLSPWLQATASRQRLWASWRPVVGCALCWFLHHWHVRTSQILFRDAPDALKGTITPATFSASLKAFSFLATARCIYVMDRGSKANTTLLCWLQCRCSPLGDELSFLLCQSYA